MKKLTLLAILLASGLLAGCSDDDDNGTDNPPPAAPRVVASVVTTAPLMDDADDALWADVDSTTVTISATSVPKLGASAKGVALPTSVKIQSVVSGTHLYMRLRWTDPTHDAYPGHYTITDVDPPIGFTRDAIAEEDQMYVMFQSPLADEYDVWGWQALRTGGAFAGQGFLYANDLLVTDSAGTVALDAAIENRETGFITPSRLPEDSTEFTGPVLYLQNSVDRETLENLATWTLGDTIPGWLIDSAMVGATHTDEQRGSIWDLRTISVYDDEASEYTLVFRGPLASTYTDDIELAALDSIQVMLAVFDNQNDFSVGGTGRGFTQKFWLILPD